jgi:uncharacterized protein
MKQLTSWLLIGFLVAITAIVAGCASPPSHFYALNSTAQSNGAPAEKCSVIVGPVFIPASVDRPQFVITTAPNSVQFEEFNRWAAPLDDSIARVVSADLVALLGTPHVASASMPGFGPSYHVTIRVERFESERGSKAEAHLDALWVIVNPAGQSAGSGRTTIDEPANANDFDALAAAHSRALAKLSNDIATAIRTDTDKKP